MSNHTPGPWLVGSRADQTIWADGLRVASVECPRKEWRANASLIAAAPDMLAALKLAEQNAFDRPALAAIRAAIAKAQGEG
jgi:hypothetical protein